MFRIAFSKVVSNGVVLVAIALGGCSSMKGGGSMSAGPGKSVLAGKTAFVDVPSGQGRHQVVAYTVPGGAICPECEAAAANYFETGDLDHRVCKTCGSTIFVGQGTLVNTK